MNRSAVLSLVFLVLTAMVHGETSFWLKNADQALFLYWTIPGAPPAPTPVVLAGLPLAFGGPHRVLGGERVRVVVPEGQSLVGVYMPWNEGPSWASRLSGGWITAREAPTAGTLVVDRASFRASNRGRLLEATLAEWGLELPRFVLDGLSDDWTAVPALLEWGGAFTPPGGWPEKGPRPRSLQVVDRDGFVWLRLVTDDRRYPAGAEASLLLQRPGAVLEWTLTGSQTLYSWSESGTQPEVVGRGIFADGVFEAALPKDRLSTSEWKAWAREPSTWALGVTDSSGAKAYPLGAFSWESLP